MLLLAKSKNLMLIKDLLSRRRQLVNMRTKELNRVKIMGKALEASCKRMIRSLDLEIARTEKALDKLIEKESEWSAKKAL